MQSKCQMIDMMRAILFIYIYIFLLDSESLAINCFVVDSEVFPTMTRGEKVPQARFERFVVAAAVWTCRHADMPCW